MTEQNIFYDDSDLRKYRTELPNLADDDMDPFQYRLYAHYKRVCGANGGTCWESVRTTAKKCQMSPDKVTDARNWLEQNGWIETRKEEQGTVHVTILDRWLDNMMRYTNGGHTKYRTGHTKYRTGVYDISYLRSNQEEVTKEEDPVDTVSQPTADEPLQQRNGAATKKRVTSYLNGKSNGTTGSYKEEQKEEATHQPPSTTVRPPSSRAKRPPANPLTQPILVAICEAKGDTSVTGGDAKWAKEIANKYGHMPNILDVTKGCYLWVKGQDFWRYKVVDACQVYKHMPEYLRWLQDEGIVTAQSSNQPRVVSYTLED